MNITTLREYFVPATRVHKFRITGRFASVDLPTSEVYCKSASLPEATIGTIDIPIRGRTYHFPGDRNFSEWTCTLYLDKDFTLHKNLINWQNEYNDPDNNTYKAGKATETLIVEVLAADAKTVARTCELIECFPTKVGQIQLDSTSVELATVDATFVFTKAVYK